MGAGKSHRMVCVYISTLMLFIWFRLLLYRNSSPFGTCLTGGWAHLSWNPKGLLTILCRFFYSEGGLCWVCIFPTLGPSAWDRLLENLVWLLRCPTEVSFQPCHSWWEATWRHSSRTHCTSLFQVLCSAALCHWSSFLICPYRLHTQLQLPSPSCHAIQLFAKPTDFVVIVIDLFVFVPHIMEGSWVACAWFPVGISCPCDQRSITLPHPVFASERSFLVYILTLWCGCSVVFLKTYNTFFFESL